MVKVYSANTCPNCQTVKDALQQQGVPFEVVNIDEDAEAKAYIMSRGVRGIPVIERPNWGELSTLYIGTAGLKEFLDAR